MAKELTQARAPLFEALRAFSKERVVPFDVPGHKRGKGNPELTEFLGQRCMDVDVNSMKPLDNLVPSRFGDPGGRAACGGRLWRGPRIFFGQRHYRRRAGNDPQRLQKRG